MRLSLADWHRRFNQQAAWTRDLRAYVYAKAGMPEARHVLEVGCGTGAITSDLEQACQALIFGLDIDLARLGFARKASPRPIFTQGDALSLPFAADTFDITLCHYLLLWTPAPLQVVREMARVTSPGGWVLILAEPDYGGRVDFPPELGQLGDWQQAALRRQGADPHMGRRIRGLLHAAGLQHVQSGVTGAQWSSAPDPEEREIEWQVLFDDFGEDLPAGEFYKLKALDNRAWESGQRVLFVPTFYAFGEKG